MGKLTVYGRNLLKKLATGTAIIHSQDGDRAWLCSLGDHPVWGDLDWREMATLRNAGFIGDEDDGDDESRFPAPEVITEKGRSALAQQTEGER